MRPTRALHELGQSVWLDNVTRDLLNSGTLQGYINDFSVTGLTSNPTIFDHAIKSSTTYDGDIASKAASAKPRELPCRAQSNRPSALSCCCGRRDDR
jgi:transaldolase